MDGHFNHLALARWPFSVVPKRELCTFLAGRHQLRKDITELLATLSRRETMRSLRKLAVHRVERILSVCFGDVCSLVRQIKQRVRLACPEPRPEQMNRSCFHPAFLLAVFASDECARGREVGPNSQLSDGSADFLSTKELSGGAQQLDLPTGQLTEKTVRRALIDAILERTQPWCSACAMAAWVFCRTPTRADSVTRC